MNTHCISNIRFLQAIVAAIILVIASSCTEQPGHPAPVQAGADVAIDVASLKPEVPVFYTFRYKDKPISFFVINSGNKVVSFLDACANCYVHKRGYEYNDGIVTCRHCGSKYPVSKLGKGLGGCYPIKIEGRMESGKYLIPVAALERDADKF